MGLLWDACGARAARAEGVARARDCETQHTLQNSDAINPDDDINQDINHKPQSEGVNLCRQTRLNHFFIYFLNAFLCYAGFAPLAQSHHKDPDV